MSDSAGGGEGGGGTAGAGQDAEADSEPPLRPPPSPVAEAAELGSLLEDAAFPSAKRLKMSEAIKGPLQPHMSQKIPEEVKAQTDPQQEEDVPPGPGKVSSALCAVKDLHALICLRLES